MLHLEKVTKFMLILLSPSKTQDFATESTILKPTQSAFQTETQELIQLLKSYSQEDISKLMSISEKLAKLNFQRFQDFKPRFTRQNSKPALEAFQGDVYQYIDINNYNTKQLAYAQSHLRIISGLYGLLKPLDLIQPYRLEMKTKLINKQGPSLYQFWGSKITNEINKTKEPIINLASEEYFKVIQPAQLQHSVYKINFKEKKGDTYKTVAIHAKRARGSMANYIIQNRLQFPEDLKSFRKKNYRFSKKLSKEFEFTFIR